MLETPIVEWRLRLGRRLLTAYSIRIVRHVGQGILKRLRKGFSARVGRELQVFVFNLSSPKVGNKK